MSEVREEFSFTLFFSKFVAIGYFYFFFWERIDSFVKQVIPTKTCLKTNIQVFQKISIDAKNLVKSGSNKECSHSVTSSGGQGKLQMCDRLSHVNVEFQIDLKQTHMTDRNSARCKY